MPTFAPDYLERTATEIFVAAGVPSDEAALVANELVYANLLGMDSHGVIRIAQYIDTIEEGGIIPGAPTRVTRESATTAIVEGGNNFGQVVAFRALDIAIAKARAHNVSCVIAQGCNHVGRLGAYPERAATQEMICLATATWPSYGHHVAPFGGREGRLSTNPISYSAPTGKTPLLADFATSVLSEGRIRVSLHSEKALPADTIVDGTGQATRDPAAFYGPPKGAILPFGGAVGYKGYALSLLVEILGGTLAGQLVDDGTRLGNGLFLLVINPEAFLPLADFKSLMESVAGYMKSAALASGYDEILMPGEREFRTLAQRRATGVPVADTTWEQILTTAAKVNVTVSESPGSG